MSAKPFWEQEGRNPLVAAFVVTSLIMALYGFAGSLLGNGFVLADQLRRLWSDSPSPQFSGNILENIAQAYRRYQVLILSLTTAMQFAVFGGLTALVFKKWHGLPLHTYFRIQRPSPVAMLLAGLGTLCILPPAIFLGELASRAFPILQELEGVGNALIRADSPAKAVLVVFAIGITPALCEEFLFRGYFQRSLERGMRQPWSYLVSGVFFALIHQNYFGLATLILVGIFLGFVYTRFGNFWPGVLVHFMYNSSLLLMVNRPNLFGWFFADSGFVRLPWVLAGSLGLTLLVWWIWRGTPSLSAAPAQDAAIQP